MAVFNNYNVSAGTLQQAERMTVSAPGRDDALRRDHEFISTLRDLQGRAVEASAARALSDEDGAELVEVMAEATREAESDTPRRSRVSALLGRARELTAGITATAGLAEAVHGLINAIG